MFPPPLVKLSVIKRVKSGGYFPRFLQFFVRSAQRFTVLLKFQIAKKLTSVQVIHCEERAVVQTVPRGRLAGISEAHAENSYTLRNAM